MHEPEFRQELSRYFGLRGAITNFVQDAPSTAGGTVAFEIEDLDRLVDDLKTKGVIFKGDIIHSPVCRMAVCLDSEGNSLLLHQLKRK